MKVKERHIICTYSMEVEVGKYGYEGARSVLGRSSLYWLISQRPRDNSCDTTAPNMIAEYDIWPKEAEDAE